MEKHVLLVFPHPDDEIFASGSAIQWRQRGIPVTYVCATLGEMGRNMGVPAYANRETLPQVRKQELLEACRLIGIDDLRLLGLRDKTLEFEDLDELADRLLTIIQEINPSLIITFYPGYSGHPDHNTCGEIVIRAVQKIPEEKRPPVYCRALVKNAEQVLGKPDITWDVSEVLEQKIDALKAHRTQVIGTKNGLGERLSKRDTESMNWFRFEHFWIYPIAKKGTIE